MISCFASAFLRTGLVLCQSKEPWSEGSEVAYGARGSGFSQSLPKCYFSPRVKVVG